MFFTTFQTCRDSIIGIRENQAIRVSVIVSGSPKVHQQYPSTWTQAFFIQFFRDFDVKVRIFVILSKKNSVFI